MGKFNPRPGTINNLRFAASRSHRFNLNFINHYDAGESYTEKEHRDWLTDAGFIDIERANFLLDDGSGLITARKQI